MGESARVGWREESAALHPAGLPHITQYLDIKTRGRVWVGGVVGLVLDGWVGGALESPRNL